MTVDAVLHLGAELNVGTLGRRDLGQEPARLITAVSVTGAARHDHRVT